METQITRGKSILSKESKYWLYGSQCNKDP